MNNEHYYLFKNKHYGLVWLLLLMSSCQLYDYGAKTRGTAFVYRLNPFVRNVKHCKKMAAYGAHLKHKKKGKGYIPPGGPRSLATNPPPPQPQPVASTKTIMENGIPMIVSTEPSPSPVKIRKDLPPPDATLTPDKVKNYKTNGTKPKLVLEPVHFDSGKADVDVGASLQFQEALEYGLLGYHILIEGHTDDIGTAESNLKLSMKRINEIRTMLVHVGIDDNHVSIMPYGESLPLVPNTTEANRRKNRRVQFLIF